METSEGENEAVPDLRYASWRETYLVRDDAYYGDMAARHQERVRHIHAVEIIDGRPAATTVCGRSDLAARDLSPERDWVNVEHIVMRAKCCLAALGMQTLGGR